MACTICGLGGHNSRTCLGEHQTCPNCGKPTANMNDYAERHDTDYCSPMTSTACWGAGEGMDDDEILCEGCAEPIKDESTHVDFNGEDWHESCFEVSGSPLYCCGIMYDNGEDTCRSCGEPL